MDQDDLISGLDEVLGTGEPENEYVARIMNEYGPPAFLNDKGWISKLGEPFWAALRTHETNTIFSPEENAFYRYNDSNGLYSKITEGALRTDFAHRILTAAKRWKEWAGLERFRSSAQINGIIRHLEGQTEVIDAFRSRQDWQAVIILRSDDEVDGRRAADDFLAFGLRDAAGHRDQNMAALAGGGLLQAAHPAKLGIDLLRRLLTDVAGVENDEIGVLSRRGLDIAFRRQGVRHTLRIVDVHLAAKGFYVDFP